MADMDERSTAEYARRPLTNMADAGTASWKLTEMAPMPATYPTSDAYEAACAALEMHRARADKAEAERDEARAEVELLEGDLADFRNAGDTVAATRHLANEANAALRSQILAALGEEDDGRTPLSDQLAQLVAELDRVRAEVTEMAGWAGQNVNKVRAVRAACDELRRDPFDPAASLDVGEVLRTFEEAIES